MATKKKTVRKKRPAPQKAEVTLHLYIHDKGDTAPEGRRYVARLDYVAPRKGAEPQEGFLRGAPGATKEETINSLFTGNPDILAQRLGVLFRDSGLVKTKTLARAPAAAPKPKQKPPPAPAPAPEIVVPGDLAARRAALTVANMREPMGDSTKYARDATSDMDVAGVIRG